MLQICIYLTVKLKIEYFLNNICNTIILKHTYLITHVSIYTNKIKRYKTTYKNWNAWLNLNSQKLDLRHYDFQIVNCRESLSKIIEWKYF